MKYLCLIYFDEAKLAAVPAEEQLGGFYLIEARDLNQALQIAAKIPPGRLGCVEVRPVKEWE
ncbi:YciI family protein [Pseudomonas aeruginosa]